MSFLHIKMQIFSYFADNILHDDRPVFMQKYEHWLKYFFGAWYVTFLHLQLQYTYNGE